MTNLNSEIKKQSSLFLVLLRSHKDPQYGIDRIIESLEEFNINTQNNIKSNKQYLTVEEFSTLNQFVKNYQFVKQDLENYKLHGIDFDKKTSINLILRSYKYYQNEFFEINDTFSKEEETNYIDSILFPLMLIADFIETLE